MPEIHATYKKGEEVLFDGDIEQRADLDKKARVSITVSSHQDPFLDMALTVQTRTTEGVKPVNWIFSVDAGTQKQIIIELPPNGSETAELTIRHGKLQ